MERRTVVLTALLLGVACLLTTSTADAGVVYTDETAFNAAVAGMGLTTIWTEDFESFAIGGVTDPLSIGGGAAEIGYGGGGAILDVPTSANAWVQDFGAPGTVTIQGPGGTSLGLQAISFNFGNQVNQTVSFVTTPVPDTSVYNTTSTPTTQFAGWLSAGPETVSSVQLDLSQGIALDNARGIAVPNPEPSTFMLFGLGAAGLYFAHRRRKTRPAN
jgi:hypothetical protein